MLSGYTADYCKKRITTLRERYTKLKKEELLKSGSGATPYNKKNNFILSQFTFLDPYIQRRRSVTNMKGNKRTLEEATSSPNIHKTTTMTNNSSCKKKCTLLESKAVNVDENVSDDSLLNCENNDIRKDKVKRAYKDDDPLKDLTKAAINICSQLQSVEKAEVTEKNIHNKSSEEAFSEFLALSLKNMQEPERSIRRNKIFNALTAPLD
ncbi:uncharacterized protein [Prorops nasuta]|uniref:uncharacterized protein n=1 Tax=Prorops nasuta TaxID=863751 RepID=UPI0034CEC161